MARQFSQMNMNQPQPQVPNAFQHIQQQPINLNSIWDTMGPEAVAAEATEQVQAEPSNAADQEGSMAGMGMMQSPQPWMNGMMMRGPGPLYTPPPQLIQQTQQVMQEQTQA